MINIARLNTALLVKPALAIALTLSASPALSAPAQTLTVKALGFKSTQGHVRIFVYRKEKNFLYKPKKAFRSQKVSLKKKSILVRFQQLPQGKYAVVIHHDENKNNKVDANFIGIPIEGAGVSNNVKPKFGPPQFKDAAFLFNKKKTLVIQVGYFGKS